MRTLVFSVLSVLIAMFSIPPMMVHGQAAPVLYFLAFTPISLPADKLECRKAIAHAVDRGVILNSLAGQLRGAQVANTIQHPRLPNTYKHVEVHQYDPAKAREFWGLCGFSGTLTIRASHAQAWVGAYYRVLQETLSKALGSPVVVDTVDFGTLFTDVRARRVPIYTAGWQAKPADYDPNNMPLSMANVLVSDPEVREAVNRREAEVVERMLLEKTLIIPILHF